MTDEQQQGEQQQGEQPQDPPPPEFELPWQPGPIPDPRLMQREAVRQWNEQAIAQLQAIRYPVDTRGVLLTTLLDVLFLPEERLIFELEFESRMSVILGASLRDAQRRVEEAKAQARRDELLAPVRGNGRQPGPNRQQRRGR